MIFRECAREGLVVLGCLSAALVGCAEPLAICRSDADCLPCKQCSDRLCHLDVDRLNACGWCGPEPAEVCGDGLDNDCDGQADEGCAFCGNGLLDAGEACDDGNAVTETACSYGTVGCVVCDEDCENELSLTGNLCGDGVPDASNEACDDGNAITEAECTYGVASCTSCDGTCQNELLLQGRYCGDGIIDPEELCDGGDLGGETCASQTGMTEGNLSCAPSCLSFDISSCHTCGNGIREGPEECDTAGASLTCSADCTGRRPIAIAGGGRHTCAVLDTGAVKCWGADDFGQLGDGGTNASQNTPVAVDGIDGATASATAIAAGGHHTCAVLDTGAVRCWGRDNNGQLGDGGANANQGSPVDVDGIDGTTASAIAVSAGWNHNCVVLDTGALRCWGRDEYGQLGDGGTDTNQSSPVDVEGIDGTTAFAVAVAAGGYHTCTLLDTGAIECWGLAAYGRLGNGDPTTDYGTPVDVLGIDGTNASAVVVIAGNAHNCAVLDTAALQCWGYNYWGQLGNGRSYPFHIQSVRVDVIGIDGTTASAAAIAGGRNHTCAVIGTGAVKCWGKDDLDQLGDGGTNTDQSTPVDVYGIDGTTESAVAIAAGWFHTCAVLETGAVQCWGANDAGQLGNGGIGSTQSTPVTVIGFP